MRTTRSLAARITGSLAIGFAIIMLGATVASAQVVVTPDQVSTSSNQTFTVSVPNDKESIVTSIRVVIPDGVTTIVPNVKPGWAINTKKDGSGSGAKVTELTWSGGGIPIGLRDQFLFSAEVPSSTKTLEWKAYQTYQDGTVVSWDQASGTKQTDKAGAFSTTKVVNDLTNPATSPIVYSLVALVIGLISLAASIVVLRRSR